MLMKSFHYVLLCFCWSVLGKLLVTPQATRDLKHFNYSQTTVMLFIRVSNTQIQNIMEKQLYETKYNNKERHAILRADFDEH